MRVVEGIEGSVDMAVELIVRFDYGSIVPWVQRVDGRWRAVAGPDGLELFTPVRLRGPRSDLRRASSPSARVSRSRSCSVGSRRTIPVGVPDDADALLDDTTDHWNRWSARCAYSGEWREPVLRSLLTLEALTFEPTGGIVAAPTTSLPETIGGSRNWDYRYCWVRDATLTLEALLIGGFEHEALRWREWLLRAAAGDPQSLQTMYGVAGERRLTELELDWLPGYEDRSRCAPATARTRSCNSTCTASCSTCCGRRRARARRRAPTRGRSRGCCSTRSKVAGASPTKASGRCAARRRHFTHSKVMCWVAFDRAIAMVEQAGYEGPVDHWREIRDEIHAEVCAHGYDEEKGAFTQSFGSNALDASVLMIPLVGFLPADDPRVRSTVEVIRRELTHDGFVPRYDSDRSTMSTASASPRACSCPCSFWMVEALALAGEHDAARASFEHCSASRTTSGCSPRSTTRPRDGSSATSRRRSRTSRSWPPRTRSHPTGRRIRAIGGS